MIFDFSLFPLVANGNTYTESSFDNLGYVTALPNAVSDVLSQLDKLYCSTTSTSVTIPGGVGGAFSWTMGTGLAYQVGQTIALVSQANPNVNWVTFQITAYNTSTGFTQGVCTSKAGAGTISSWYAVPLGYDSLNASFETGNYGLTVGTLGSDQGSLGVPMVLSGGNAVYDQQRGSAWLGLESPNNSMIEIFEDFLQLNASHPELLGATLGTQANGYIAPPWYYTTVIAGATGVLGNTKLAAIPSGNSFTNYAYTVLSYGNNGGWLHIGRGAIVMEFSFTNFSPVAGCYASFGLSACGATNPVKNIFANGGVGFNINSAGYLECLAGVSGSITKIVTSTLFNVGTNYSKRFRVEIDHTGTIANFYYSDALVATITGVIGGQGVTNLLLPALECINNVTSFGGMSYSLDSFYLAKYLMR